MSPVHDKSLDATSQSKEPLPLWRNLDYILLVGGQGISYVGSQISLIAFPLLILALTNSAAETGITTALRTLPYALITLPAGALVDRWDRKKIMIFSDLGRALALGSIVLAFALGQLTPIHLYLVSLIEGTLTVCFTVAEISSFPRVVAPKQLPTANGQHEFVLSVGGMVGPALGPILYSVGRAVPFLVDAISYSLSAFSLIFIKTQFQEERADVDQRLRNLWGEIKEGLVWLWQHSVLRFLALLTFGLITPCYGYALILIILTKNIGATEVETGLIFGAGGVGSLVGALLTAPLYHRFGFGKVLIGSAWVWSIFWLLYVIAPDPLTIGVLNAVSFAVVPVYLSTLASYRMIVIPDALRGRVNSVFRLIAFSGQPIGIALTGILLQFLGPTWTVVILFIPQGILALIATLNKQVRSIQRIEEGRGESSSL